MAIGTPSQSPAIVIKEVDLSGVVPNVQSTMGAIVGNYRWGPVETRERISDESQLAATFGNPDDTHSIDFHTAAYYLRYSSDLTVTRTINGAINAHDATATGTDPVVKNRDNWDGQLAARDSDGHTFIAKWPGAMGNTIKVSVCPAHTASFSGWAYKSSFDNQPGTSASAADANAQNDEIHIAVIDNDGKFGAKGAVLETFPFVSLATNSKQADGSTNYSVDVVNNASQYVWMAGFETVFTSVGAGTTADSGENFILSSPEVKTYQMAGGTNSAALTPTQVATGFDQYEDQDTVEVDFLIATIYVC